MLNIFSCAFWPSVCVLWRNVCLDLLPILWLGCLFFWYWAAWVVCIFWRLIPCRLLCLQIFSPIVWIVFVLFMVSFAVQKLLSFIRSHLLIFVFVFITLGGGSKKTLFRFMSESVLLMFSSKSFIISVLTFRSLILPWGFHSAHTYLSEQKILAVLSFPA